MFYVGILIVAWVALAIGGFVYISGDDSDDGGHCNTASSCNSLIVTVLQQCIFSSRISTASKDILAIGLSINSQAYSAFMSYQSHVLFSYDIVNTAAGLSSIDFNDYKSVYIPSDDWDTSGGISCGLVSELSTYKPQLVEYVNVKGGSLSVFTLMGCGNTAYDWLPIALSFTSTDISALSIQQYLSVIVPGITDSSLFHCCYHTKFTGPPGYSGLNILATDPADGYPIILGGLNVLLTSKDCSDGTHANDPDCYETQCADGIDNNLNGLTDCEDFNCQSIFPACSPTLSPAPPPTSMPTSSPTALVENELYLYKQLLASKNQRICQGSIEWNEDSFEVTCTQHRGSLRYSLYSGQMRGNRTAEETLYGFPTDSVEDLFEQSGLSSENMSFPLIENLDMASVAADGRGPFAVESSVQRVAQSQLRNSSNSSSLEATVRAYFIRGLNSTMDTSLTCSGKNRGLTSLTKKQLSIRGSFGEVSDGEMVMLQQFLLPSELVNELVNSSKRLYAAYLFQRGSPVGGTGAGQLFAADRNQTNKFLFWEKHYNSTWLAEESFRIANSSLHNNGTLHSINSSNLTDAYSYYFEEIDKPYCTRTSTDLRNEENRESLEYVMTTSHLSDDASNLETANSVTSTSFDPANLRWSNSNNARRWKPKSFLNFDSILDHVCHLEPGVAAPHVNGWVMLDVSRLVECQLNHTPMGYSSFHTIALAWKQEDLETESQSWLSSNSEDPPLLSLYFR